MIEIRDVAAVAAVTLDADEHDGHAGQTYDLTGPSPITFADVAAALTEATGRPVGSVDLTEEQARKAMLGPW